MLLRYSRNGFYLIRHLSTAAAGSIPKRERMEFDVLIVGGGCAGLSAAIRLKDKAPKLSVCLIDKGAEIGSHIISGNLFDPIAFNELIPNWKSFKNDEGNQVFSEVFQTPSSSDTLYYMFNKHAVPMPTPRYFGSHGCYVISLAMFCRSLASHAEKLGVEIYSGFAASEILFDSNKVIGVTTNDVGISKEGKQKESYSPGVELLAKQTILAEVLTSSGTRGSLTEMIIDKYNLRDKKSFQSYGLGIKELWEIDPNNKLFKAGKCLHTLGYPYSRRHKGAHGGGFLYFQSPNLAHIGHIVGLDYKNPYISPYEEFQKWKLHPLIRKYLEGGKCIGYGARCLNEAGLQSTPKLVFPGGVLIGGSAGFMNFPRLKESHLAMKSGILAADTITENSESIPDELNEYSKKFESSWAFSEMNSVRNVQPAMKWKPHLFGSFTPFGMFYTALTGYLFKGREPWTFHRKNVQDHDATQQLSQCRPIDYPKPDNKITFDILSNLIKSGVAHEEDQPCHLTFRTTTPSASEVPSKISYPIYGGIEERFCPAKVYEYIEDPENPSQRKLQINSSNCVHCKCCDIKAINNLIKWTVPEGGGGPAYERM